MIRYQAARCYSKALLQFSTSKQGLEKRLNDLEAINKCINENPKLLQYLNAPDIPLDEKKVFLKKILNEDFDTLVSKFIFFLLERNRLNFIAEITREYSRRVRKIFGILEVQLISALPFDQEDKERLKIKFQQSYPRKVISFVEKIDPEIIGGMIAIVNHRIIDYSVRNQLAILKNKLLAVPMIN